MSALMSDIVEGTIDPNDANAVVNAGRQLLRVTEMKYRWAPNQTLMLAPGEPKAVGG